MPDVPRMSQIFAELRSQLAPDGQRLLDAVEANDDRVELGRFTEETDQQMLGDLIDPASVYGVSLLRAAQVLVGMTPVSFLSAPQEAVAAVWLDGVVAGIEFQKRGGHIG